MKESLEYYLPVLLVDTVVETEDGIKGREARRRHPFQQNANLLDGRFKNTSFIKQREIV